MKRIKNNDETSDSFYQKLLKKAATSLAVESPKNMLVDSFNNSYLVATNLIMNAINRALDKRTNLIFAELISNTRVRFAILLFLILNRMIWDSF